MNIFLDANVIVSVLNHEYPVFSYSSRILSLADRPGYKLFTSPISFAIAFYFCEKKSGTKLAREKIRILSEKLHFTEINQATVELVINNKRIHDLEDGLQYYSALSSRCKYIVTEDREGFYYSEMEVLNCSDFLSRVVF